MSCGIYKIENLESGKVYIGSSTNISRRIKDHKFKLNSTSHANDYLQKSWDKYGDDSFEFGVLLYCSADKLEFYEQRAIDEYESYERGKGYNLLHKVDRSEYSEEMKDKISKTLEEYYNNNDHPIEGRPVSEEVKNKIAESVEEWHNENEHPKGMQGKTLEDEHIEAIVEANTGSKCRDETKRKIGEANKGKKNGMSKLTEDKVKQIKRKLDDKSNPELASEFNVNRNTISAIRNKRTWSHVEVDSE